MDLQEAKELLEENGYILDEGIFDSIKNKFFKKKEAVAEVKPKSKKLHDDQIEKTSVQAYNHTTESMSVLKQIATNFNGKKTGEFKQLWSGLSKLLNKHGMSVKNHNYYLGVTNNNAEFSVWAYIANPDTDWTEIKIIGKVKANVSEYKYTTNYDLDDSSLKGQAEDLNEWLVELDSIALKLFKGASREEWEEGAHQNESKVNKAIKLLESAGYIVERLLDGPILNELGYNSIVKNIVDIIERVYPVQNYQDRDTQQTYTKAEYEIELENGRTFIVEFSKGHGFEYRGRFYPWKLIEENNGGYTTIAYNFDMLVKWTRKVKALG